MKTINIRGQLMDFTTPKVMGIINVTPDSFFSGSRKNTEKEIGERIEHFISEGVDILDLGGQSTSPWSTFLQEDEEWARLAPALAFIRKKFPNLILSVDTFYSGVAARSVKEFGVDIINDISGGSIDPMMFPVVAELNVPYILMHMRGTPQTMQQQTEYTDFIPDILYYFSEKINRLNELGVKDIIIDPGFGFSKNMTQNYELMSHLELFKSFDNPILVGISRKSMIYKFLEIDPEGSLCPSVAMNMYALTKGASILRVHDVKETAECVRLFSRLNHCDILN